LKIDEINNAVGLALAEDIGTGDVTTMATVDEDAIASAVMRAREQMTVCGLAFAESSFKQVSAAVEVTLHCADGEVARPGASLMTVTGPARALLSAERVALNFIQRLSGVATSTRCYVEAVQGTKAKILDTRKTTPGWRNFEKYAVTCGGGRNHRHGLYDMVLIKDNHLAALREELPNAIAVAVRRSRERCPNLKVEVEADTVAQVQQAVEAGADIILLDNMTLLQLRESVSIVRGRMLTEASGGVNLETVKAIAETGVDMISVGGLTHSAKSVDIGLDFIDT
jgi:nicotinate-nucleotide pyrophosphorylase (carboxylating)